MPGTNPSLTHRARIETTIAGELPDRTPVALWRHFPIDDQAPDSLAAATAAFQRLYDYDLIKVTPSSSFCIRDWGIQDEWRGEPEGTRQYTRRVIRAPEDWEKLALLDPTNGHLGAQLECLRLLVKEFSPNTPLLQTVFSPLSQAKNLVGPAELLVHLRKWPEAVKAGLQRISEVTARFISEARKTGVDGIFYAVQHAQYNLLSEEEFDVFGRTYDLPILESSRDLWLNMVHLHGEQVMFSKVNDYPVQVINWHDRQTTPSLKEALNLFPGTLCGGLRQWETMLLASSQQVRIEALDAIQSTSGRRLILGTGCVTPTTAPYGNLLAARRAVE
jgi:uroporphyrinogen decarboxylase